MLNSVRARLILLLVLAVTGTLVFRPDEQRDLTLPPTKSQSLVQDCTQCHVQANNNVVPRLDGQNKDYLLKALNDFQQGARKDPAMTPSVKDLKPQDLVDLANHFAALKGPQSKSDPKIAKLPIVESCTSCHRLNPPLVNPAWPNLAGQKKGYLLKALNDFRQGHRQAPAMVPIALGLNKTDMEMLAEFFANIK